MDLKDILFRRVRAELSDCISAPEDEKKLKQQRFYAVFEILLDAGLDDEFDDWCDRRKSKPVYKMPEIEAMESCLADLSFCS